MTNCIVINVCYLEGNDPLQNVLQVPNDISWENFELLLKLTFECEHMQAKYLDEDNEEISINSHAELVEAFKVASKQQNTLHINILPTKPPPIDIIFGDPDESAGVKVDVKKRTAQLTNHKARNEQPKVVVMDADEGYIKPTTEDCVIVEDEDSATVIVEDLEELQEPVIEVAAAEQSPVAEHTMHVVTQEPQPSTSTETGEQIDVLPKTAPAEEKKIACFRLLNSATRLVLDVEGWGSRAGTPLIVYRPKDTPERCENQLFYTSAEHGCIVSVASGLCVDATDHEAMVSPIYMGQTSQQWIIKDLKIQHRFNPNWVVGVDDSSDVNKVCAMKYEGKEHQHWMTEYIETEDHLIMKPQVLSLYTWPALSGGGNMGGVKLKKGKKLEKRLRKDYHKSLAESVGRLMHEARGGRSGGDGVFDPDLCLESGETSRPSVLVSTGPSVRVGDEIPPENFQRWMEKFKLDLANDISQKVSRDMVGRVLAGLEGAVIASVPGTSGQGPVPLVPTSVLQSGSHSRQGSVDSNASSASSTTVYCHKGVLCDHCDRTIVGIRYKCGNCEDYDLCEECEVLDGVHDPQHVFLKIRRPTLTAGRKHNGKMIPLLKRSVYVSPEQIQIEVENKVGKDVKKEELKAARAAEKLAHKASKMAAKFQKYDEKIKKQEMKETMAAHKREEKVKRKEERLKRRGEAHRPQKETPSKKERLDLPQLKLRERMDAEFVEDITFPDGSHIQPGTKFVKRWLLRNIGTHAWSSSTKLKHLWGGMEPLSTDVSVPCLECGEEGVISVQLLAPQQPGIYQSHWRLSHHGLYFGHRVWCHIVVDEKEVLEHSGEEAEQDSVLNVQRADYQPVKGSEDDDDCVAVEDTDDDCEIIKVEEEFLTEAEKPEAETGEKPEVMTDKDIEMFEMLDIRDRNVPKVSQTATPNNTPLVVSPPKSPTLDLDVDVLQTISSSSSSVEVVSEPSPTTDRMTELVQERIACLGLKPDVDLQSLSSCTSESDSDADFYIVPLPDCFNPDLPCSISTSTSVVIRKEGDSTMDDFSAPAAGGDSLSHASSSSSVPELVSCTPSPFIKRKAIVRGVMRECLALAPVEPLSRSSSTSSIPDLVACTPPPEPTWQDEPQLVDLTKSEEIESEPATDSVEGAVGGEPEVTSDENGNSSEASTPAAEQNTDLSGNPRRAAREKSPGELASNITVAALGVLSQAAVSAFTLTKDVFSTLQAQQKYVPPKSNWKPKDQKFVPPKSDWTPPKQTAPPTGSDEWTPPKEPWSPADQTEAAPAPAEPLTPLGQLIEMGFGNRELNERLLKENNNDLQKVVQELVHQSENDWSQNRH